MKKIFTNFGSASGIEIKEQFDCTLGPESYTGADTGEGQWGQLPPPDPEVKKNRVISFLKK